MRSKYVTSRSLGKYVALYSTPDFSQYSFSSDPILWLTLFMSKKNTSIRWILSVPRVFLKAFPRKKKTNGTRAAYKYYHANVSFRLWIRVPLNKCDMKLQQATTMTSNSEPARGKSLPSTCLNFRLGAADSTRPVPHAATDSLIKRRPVTLIQTNPRPEPLT